MRATSSSGDQTAGARPGRARQGDENFCIVVVFKDSDARDAFIKRAAIPDNRYQSGEDIKRLCGFVEEFGE
jgi:hypothetical protein